MSYNSRTSQYIKDHDSVCDGDGAVMEIVEKHMPIIYKQARKYYKGDIGVTYEDIVCTGILGILEAIKKHDGNGNLSCFISIYVQRHIIDYVVQLGNPAYASRAMFRRHRIKGDPVRIMGKPIETCINLADDRYDSKTLEDKIFTEKIMSRFSNALNNLDKILSKEEKRILCRMYGICGYKKVGIKKLIPMEKKAFRTIKKIRDRALEKLKPLVLVN